MSRVVVYAISESVRRWISDEAADLDCAFYFAVSVADAHSALSEASGQILIVDVDALGPVELQQLQLVVDVCPARVFVALGIVTKAMQHALHITHVVPRPFGSERLRSIIADLETRGRRPDTELIP